MKLENARIVNFRQFYGQQDIEFSVFDDLKVTVFHGDNGAGKTSLFSAINWCLYDEGVDDIGELVSKRAIAEVPDGSCITTSVQITFIHQARRYIADRFLVVQKTKEKTKRIEKGFSLIRIKASGDHEIIGNAIGTMNSILPSNVRPYFFFDGEKMDDLTKANSEEVTTAIRNIMRLPALERAKDHLNSIAYEYRKEIAKQGPPKIEQLTKQEQHLREEKDENLSRKTEIETEIRLVKEKIENVEESLRGTEETKKLQLQRDEINSLIKKLEYQEENLLFNVQRISNRCYVKFLPDSISKALYIIDEKRERGEIPSSVREQLIHDLLGKKVCICGRDFQEGDQAFNELKALLKRTSSSKLETVVGKLGGELRSLASMFESDYESLNSFVQERVQIKELINEYYGRLDDIRRQLANSPEQDIAELERLRIKLKRQYEMSVSERGKVVGSIERLEKQIEDVVKERQAAEAKEKKLGVLSRKESLTQRAADAVEKIKEEFFENTRQEIEKETKKVFAKLAWKQEHFQDLVLDENFRLEVIDRWGMPTRQELSAGERQILSLSFVTALSNLSGEEAPLVMDTPFGRLSGNHLRAVAENLPLLTPQLILFVTDREWDEASRTKLEPWVGSQFRLLFDKSTGCTYIKEVNYL